MSDRFRSAFFAYPAAPPDLVRPITAASLLVNVPASKVEVTAWPMMNVFGVAIPDEVRTNIKDRDVIVCDVTIPNTNVYYEVGYAIGLRKPIAPVINASFAEALKNVQRDGIFDNLGYRSYENSSDLAAVLQSLPDTTLADLYAKPINISQPLFVLDTSRKTDFRNEIVSAVKAAKVFYRSFDPVETPRFSTVQIISEVTSSAGVLIPFLASHIDDAPRHNLRAAFLAGLSHGLGLPTLMIRLDTGEPVPADYRELSISVRSEADVREVVGLFALEAIRSIQTPRQTRRTVDPTALQKLSLGASAAENEFRSLSDYFVETSEFLRTRRGEVRVVAGRKGSGKTAIFYMVRDGLRSDRSNLTTDLKPESHQLSLFREQMLKMVGVGVFDHTLAAYWYFLIISELLLTIKREADFRARNDSSYLERSRTIAQLLAAVEVAETGDFTARINRLGRMMIQEVEAIAARREPLTPERLTNIIFKGGIGRMRSTLVEMTSPTDRLTFLFDNIDKGWAADGVDEFDIRQVRLLLEALEKVKRDLATQDRDFASTVFLRNDIYELLVDQTPDRGKTGQIRIDWTDRTKLRQVIWKRLQATSGYTREDFQAIWRRFFVPDVDGQDSFDFLLNHSLMRPRFLINLVEYAIANGINRGHSIVDVVDLRDAVRQHSIYLVDDFGYEIRDVAKLSADILYAFVGASKHLTRSEIEIKLVQAGLNAGETQKAFELMMWYGAIGFVDRRSEERFIYDYEYSARRLEAEMSSLQDEPLYVLNDAIYVALA